MKAQPAHRPQHTVTDVLADRVIDILDAHTDIGIIDTADGRSILTWKTTCDLAQAIAADTRLVALMQQRELGGAA